MNRCFISPLEKMPRRRAARQFLSLIAAATVCFVVGEATAETTKPNIVLIVADDLGYSDIGCFGSEIPTPHIDALAREGLRFSQFYDCAVCVPTRASLLTGLYPHQAGRGLAAEPGWIRRDVDSD